MAKAMQKLTMVIKNETELMDTLKKLSVESGGAFVFAIKPFSHEVTFEQFKNPSSVPDQFIDLTRNTMAFRGEIRGFTKAARRREQNRGLGRS
jgi:hypothetical protein